MKKRILIAIIMFALLQACIEQKDPAPFAYTKVFSGTVSKVWKLSFVDFVYNGKVMEVRTVPCGADERYTFFASEERVYTVDFGRDYCSGDPDVSKIIDNWSYSTSTATLTMIIPLFNADLSLPFIVREARKDRMVLEIFRDEANTSSFRIHFESVEEK